MRKLEFKIGIVTYNFVEIIDKWFAKEFREEAYEIVDKILNWHDIKSFEVIVEWCIYIERNMGNQISSHIDYMKYLLVKERIIEKGGKFGAPFTDEFPDDWFDVGPKNLDKILKNKNNELD